jgi:hypothetical protein
MFARTSRATIQEDHPWQLALLLIVFAVVCRRFMLSSTTSKDADGPGIGFRVVFRHVKEVLGDSEPAYDKLEVNTYYS